MGANERRRMLAPLAICDSVEVLLYLNFIGFQLISHGYMKPHCTSKLFTSRFNIQRDLCKIMYRFSRSVTTCTCIYSVLVLSVLGSLSMSTLVLVWSSQLDYTVGRVLIV